MQKTAEFISNFDKFSAEYLAPKAEKRPYVRKGVMPVDGKINSEMSDKINSIGAWVEKSDISVTNTTRIKKHGRARAFIFESGDKTITAAYIKNRFGIFLKIQEELLDSNIDILITTSLFARSISIDNIGNDIFIDILL